MAEQGLQCNVTDVNTVTMIKTTTIIVMILIGIIGLIIILSYRS